MDWKELIRGFLGYPPPRPPPSQQNADVWPPSPPTLDFPDVDRATRGDTRDHGNEHIPRRHRRISELDEPIFPRGGFFFGTRPPRPPQEEYEEEFGSNQFVFGDLFAVVGEMFQDMERSMKDMERVFENTITREHPGLIPYIFPNHEQPPALPSSENVPETTRPKNREENVRDFVLKGNNAQANDPCHSNDSNGHSHYLAEPKDPSEKVDQNLDLLYKNSMLDLSELPVPSSEDSQTPSRGQMLPRPQAPQSQQGGGSQVRIFSQRTYQTYSYRNGRMEGEVVKEDETGRHVTKYYQDENGTRHETTEFFPRDGSSPRIEDHQVPGPSTAMNPTNNGSLFELFNKVFKPRI